MFSCLVTFRIPDRSTFAFFNLLATVLGALAVNGEIFETAFKNSIRQNALHHIYFGFPYWLYFKPEVVIWLSVSPDGEVKWTSPIYILKSATHKLFKESYWVSFSTHGKDP